MFTMVVRSHSRPALAGTIYECDQTPALWSVASSSRRTSLVTPTAKALLRLDRAASLARGRLGGEAELLRQPEPGLRRGDPRVAGLLRMREHPAGSGATSNGSPSSVFGCVTESIEAAEA